MTMLMHMTATAGYTRFVFAQLDLLGQQFAHRIRDLGDQKGPYGVQAAVRPLH
jgi:TnpA family transposase